MKKARIKKLQKQVESLCARHNVLASENSVLKNRTGVLEDLLKVCTSGPGVGSRAFCCSSGQYQDRALQNTALLPLSLSLSLSRSLHDLLAVFIPSLQQRNALVCVLERVSPDSMAAAISVTQQHGLDAETQDLLQQLPKQPMASSLTTIDQELHAQIMVLTPAKAVDFW
jgi:hypothetical protein